MTLRDPLHGPVHVRTELVHDHSDDVERIIPFGLFHVVGTYVLDITVSDISQSECAVIRYTYVPEDQHINRPRRQVYNRRMLQHFVRQIHAELEKCIRRPRANVFPPVLEVAFDIADMVY